MKGFDEESTAGSYKDFRKSVLRIIEDTEIESDEKYPGALFTVDREGIREVLHVEDIEHEYEEVTLEEIVHEIVPEKIKQNNSIYFAFAFSAEKFDENTNEEDKEVVAVLSGDIFNTDMVLAEVHRDSRYAELDSWQKEDFMAYSDLVAPMRQSIVYQG